MNGYMRFFDNFFGFFKNIGISFYDSVIYDDRYKYILDGLFHTILIALFAVIIGIVLGIVIALIRHNQKIVILSNVLNRKIAPKISPTTM